MFVLGLSKQSVRRQGRRQQEPAMYVRSLLLSSWKPCSQGKLADGNPWAAGIAWQPVNLRSIILKISNLLVLVGKTLISSLFFGFLNPLSTLNRFLFHERWLNCINLHVMTPCDHVYFTRKQCSPHLKPFIATVFVSLVQLWVLGFLLPWLSNVLYQVVAKSQDFEPSNMESSSPHYSTKSFSLRSIVS
jgi:hypothetical protein